MKETLEQLESEGVEQMQAAVAARDAVSTFGLAVNGVSARVVPAPVARTLLEDIKLLLGYIQQITEHLPVALTRSLNDPRITVFEHSVPRTRGSSQECRDPRTQVDEASEQLLTLTAALDRAVGYAEVARQAIEHQRYWEKVDAATYAAELEAARKAIANYRDSSSTDDPISEAVRALRRKHGIKSSRES